MFRQFENEINTYLTEGVRTVSNVAEEFIKSAEQMKEDDGKVKSLEKQIQEQKKTIQKKDDKITEYKEKYNNLKVSKGKLKEKHREVKNKLATCQQELDRAEELLDSYRSSGSKISKSVSLDHKETQVDLLENVYVLDSSLDTPSPPPELNSKLERSIVTATDSSDDDAEGGEGGVGAVGTEGKDPENEVVVVEDNLEDTVQSIVVEPEDHSVKLTSFLKDELTKYIKENTDLTIQLQNYQLKMLELEKENESLENKAVEYEILVGFLKSNKNFWKNNFFLVLLLICVYFYLLPSVVKNNLLGNFINN